MTINGLIIEEMQKSDKLNHFSVFIYLKSIYSNSCVYNYTHQSMADRTGISHGSIRRYVGFYLKNGWARMHKGNLIFNKVRSLSKIKKTLFFKINGTTVKEIKNELYLTLLKLNSNQAKWYSNLRRDLLTAHINIPNHVLRKIETYKDFFKGKYFGESDKPGRFKVSYSKLAEWLKMSVGSVHKLIKELYVEGKLMVFIGGYTAGLKSKQASKYILMNNNKAFISKKGKVCLVNCNSYMFF